MSQDVQVRVLSPAPFDAVTKGDLTQGKLFSSKDSERGAAATSRRAYRLRKYLTGL